jgi:hypothetical protein
MANRRIASMEKAVLYCYIKPEVKKRMAALVAHYEKASVNELVNWALELMLAKMDEDRASKPVMAEEQRELPYIEDEEKTTPSAYPTVTTVPLLTGKGTGRQYRPGKV